MQTNAHRSRSERAAAMFPVKQHPDSLIKISLLDFDPALRRRFIHLSNLRQRQEQEPYTRTSSGSSTDAISSSAA